MTFALINTAAPVHDAQTWLNRYGDATSQGGAALVADATVGVAPPRSGRNSTTSPMYSGCVPPVLIPRTVKLHGRIDSFTMRSVDRTTCRRAPVSHTARDELSMPRTAMISCSVTKSTCATPYTRSVTACTH